MTGRVRTGSPMQRRCRRYADRMTESRWRTPVFPVPPLPLDYLETHAERPGRQRPIVNGWGYVQSILKASGSGAVIAVREGFNLTQAERWAVHHGKHPADIWGRLWWDMADLDTRLNARDERLALWVEQFPVIKFTPEFTRYVRSLRPTQKAAS